MADMSEHRPVETWLTDMDGVLVHEDQVIPGAPEFVEALRTSGKRFLVLTNNSFMQLGDVYTIRASLAGKDEEAQKKFNQQALDQYRGMQPKEVVVAVQERRIAYYLQLAEQSRQGQRIDEWRLYNRVAEKEREKLATIREQPDQSLEAKLKAIGRSKGATEHARV